MHHYKLSVQSCAISKQLSLNEGYNIIVEFACNCTRVYRDLVTFEQRKNLVMIKVNENHFVNFTEATFALATHVYISMHKGRLHQQVCRAT